MPFFVLLTKNNLQLDHTMSCLDIAGELVALGLDVFIDLGEAGPRGLQPLQELTRIL